MVKSTYDNVSSVVPRMTSHEWWKVFFLAIDPCLISEDLDRAADSSVSHKSHLYFWIAETRSSWTVAKA